MWLLVKWNPLVITICMCVCMYIYIYIYICVCVCVCIHTHTQWNLGSRTPLITNKFSEKKKSWLTNGVSSNDHASRQQRLATSWEYRRESVSCCVTFAQYTFLLEFAVPSLEFHCVCGFFNILLNKTPWDKNSFGWRNVLQERIKFVNLGSTVCVCVYIYINNSTDTVLRSNDIQFVVNLYIYNKMAVVNFTCIQTLNWFAIKFTSGGLHERHVVVTWNFWNHLSVRF
jgi:hypothetical protein